MDTKKRSTRTRPEHQRIIIDFVEKHPEMLTNSFRCAESRNKYNENWRILCITLNSVGYGEKSVEQWQRVLVDWLTKVKIKWINIKKDIKGTGGGPGSGSVLNDLEQRLLHLKGFSSVEGDGSTQEIGLRQLQLQTKPEEKTNGHKNYPGSTFATEALFEHDYENIMEISEYVSVDNNIEINSVSTETSTAQKRTVETSYEMNKENTTKKQKNVRNAMGVDLLKEQHAELIDIMKSIDSNTNRMATALENIASNCFNV